MDATVEKDCTVLEGLFHQTISNMKNSFALWEDFSSKGSRLHTALKTTMVCLNAFLESFQKVADMASGTKGATKDIGSALTRLCLRQRSIEAKLKLFTNSILESLVVPLMEKMEDWKKNIVIMDREHNRESKRGHQEIKKCYSEAQKEHKKFKKSGGNKQEGVEKLYKATNEKLLQTRENEMNAVRGALVEERHRLCLFVACLKPVMDEEISLLSDVTHLQEIVESLCLLADDPDSLPATGEQTICDAIGRGMMMTSTMHISPDQTSSGNCQPSRHNSTTATSTIGSNSDSLRQQQQQQGQKDPGTGSDLPASRQQSLESPSSELSAESSVGDSFSSSAASPSKTAAKSMAKTPEASKERHGGARIVGITSPPTTSSSSSAPPPEVTQRSREFSRLLTHHRNSASVSSTTGVADKEVRYLDPSSLIGCQRPQAVSYPRDGGRSGPCRHPPSDAFGVCVDGSPYAVPCSVQPKWKSARVSSEKVADIYARPSLVQSHGGYRTPNIKPLPVATPTVPDSGKVPAFPSTGYVNMNQLASISLHQSKREVNNRDSMPDMESLRFCQTHKFYQGDQLQQSTSMLIGSEGRIVGRDHRRQISLDAGQIAKLAEPSSGYDSRDGATKSFPKPSVQKLEGSACSRGNWDVEKSNI